MAENKLLFFTKFYLKNVFFMKIFGRINGLFLGSARARWDALWASVAGHDTWLVVGNGPSLRIEDLDALKGIPSIASNKINIIYDRIGWRPTLYTMADPLLLHKLPAEHYNSCGLTLIPHTHALMAKTRNKLTWKHISDHAAERRFVQGDEEPTPMTGLFVGRTITCPNLALAMWAGAKTIYLIGCDHFYANEDPASGAKRAEHQGGSSNHFDPNYRKPGEIVNAAPIELMNQGYAMMRKIADKRGVRIINISRRSALDTFERGTVEDAISQIKAGSR